MLHETIKCYQLHHPQIRKNITTRCRNALHHAQERRNDAALAYASIRPRRQHATDVQTVYPIARRQSRTFHGDKTVTPTCQILSFLIVKNG